MKFEIEIERKKSKRNYRWMISPEATSAGEGGVAKDASRTLCAAAIMGTVLPAKSTSH